MRIKCSTSHHDPERVMQAFEVTDATPDELRALVDLASHPRVRLVWGGYAPADRHAIPDEDPIARSIVVQGFIHWSPDTGPRICSAWFEDKGTEGWVG